MGLVAWGWWRGGAAWRARAVLRCCARRGMRMHMHAYMHMHMHTHMCMHMRMHMLHVT